MEKNYSFAQDGIARLRCKLTWAQLELVSTKADAFQMIIAGDDESVEELRIEQSGEELVVAQPTLTYAKEILPRRRWLQICVRIPAAFAGDVDADTVTGIIGARGFSLADVSLNTVSGSMSVRDVQAKTMFLHSVSGAISGRSIVSGRVSLRSVSGGMSLMQYQSASTKLFTISGSIDLDMVEGCKSLDGQTVSGAVSVQTDLPVSAQLHALSGQFIMDEDVQKSAEGLQIHVSSVSGDLAVKRRQENA